MRTSQKLAILGAAGGIGRVLTARAISQGWQVTALDLETSLRDHPPEGVTDLVALDVTDPSSVERAFAHVGEIGGFVNLAGFMSPVRPLGEVPLDDFDDVALL